MNRGIMEENYPTSQRTMNCIDAGSENCPCYLAVTGDCLVCSRLQGKNYCNCDWRGVCIYNEFIQGNKKVNNPRRDFEARIIERKFYKEDLVVFILDVGKGFAIKAGRPGSYLFVKGSGAAGYYDIPISVMKSDVEKGQIHLAVKIISSKTKALLLEEEKIALRGPYRNGVHGMTPMLRKKGKNHRTLIVAKGIGIAPGILASEEFGGKGTVDLIVDTEKISTLLIDDYLEGGSELKTHGRARTDKGELRYLSLTEKRSSAELERLMKQKQYDNVILLASDYYIEQIGKMVKRILPEADLAVSNNFRICCGEGLCGSCSVDSSGGDTIKMCKCQMNGQEILNKIYSGARL